ncbi:hypothetical protein ACN28I_14070 [Archangium gephyra]|uniref:hypothetical protein n=1 Tax=Archangium gephyra TaxID=48 RepID=UPI003B81416D
MSRANGMSSCSWNLSSFPRGDGHLLALLVGGEGHVAQERHPVQLHHLRVVLPPAEARGWPHGEHLGVGALQIKGEAALEPDEPAPEGRRRPQGDTRQVRLAAGAQRLEELLVGAALHLSSPVVRQPLGIAGDGKSVLFEELALLAVALVVRGFLGIGELEGLLPQFAGLLAALLWMQG